MLTLMVVTSLAMSRPSADWKIAKAPLLTRWSAEVSPSNALPEYPRPQMVRPDWQNLNGLWEYALGDSAIKEPPTLFEGTILVPFPLESALSGVAKKSEPAKRLWYRRSFNIPEGWSGKRIMLHFGAVNWDSTVLVNGKPVGEHRGGYDGFRFDITDALRPGENELVVSAWNPLLADVPEAQVLGKQRVKAEGIWYTAATGIWQTVWLEPVPTGHIARLRVTPDIDAGTVRASADVSAFPAGTLLEITALDGKSPIATRNAASGVEAILPIQSPHLWTPEDPFLYGLRIVLRNQGKVVDQVESYFAMRKVSLGKDAEGHTRIFLNNKFVFQVGALDQGYWPDGIYTAPTDAALKFDIEIAKKLGFNLLRKHAKVEPDRWYTWADRLGMLVWQDMPQGFAGKDGEITDAAKLQFNAEWRCIIGSLYNHPSVIVWTPFNEGWGQHDTEPVTALTKALDPSRLVNSASGWFDKGVGDIADLHAYPGPDCGMAEPKRASANGEFGGVTMRVDGHMWTTDVFGYGATLRGSWLATKRYQRLLKDAYALRESRHASAVVYTQLIDVEQESNGLLTYDRAVDKLDTKIVAAANRGEFPALPPNPHPDLVSTSEDEPHEWRFTTTNPATDWMQSGFSDSAWANAPAPFGNELAGFRTPWKTSDIWLRREVDLPAKLPDQLEFTAYYDEDAEIYVNGVLAASVKGYVTGYVPVPMNAAGRAALRPSTNLLAVHCKQTTGGQFIDIGIAPKIN